MNKKIGLILALGFLVLVVNNVLAAIDCGDDGWKYDWDACKTIGDRICGGGETVQNSPKDCTKCIDDGYCSIHENHANCPDECDAGCVGGAADGYCAETENAVNCPEDCVCERDYCDARNAFLECPEKCVDPESVPVEISEGRIRFPFEQSSFTSSKQESFTESDEAELPMANRVFLSYQKSSGFDLTLYKVGTDDLASPFFVREEITVADDTAGHVIGELSLNGPRGVLESITFRLLTKCFSSGYEFCGPMEMCGGSEQAVGPLNCCEGDCEQDECVAASYYKCGKGTDCPSWAVKLVGSSECCKAPCEESTECAASQYAGCGVDEMCVAGLGAGEVIVNDKTCCDGTCAPIEHQEYVMIDWLSLRDANGKECWTTSFTNPEQLITVECYDSNNRRVSAGEQVSRVVNPNPLIGQELNVSFDAFKADYCSVTVHYVKTEIATPSESDQIVVQQLSGLWLTDDEVELRKRYIDLTGVDDSWDLVQARVKLTSTGYSGKTFDLYMGGGKAFHFEDADNQLKIVDLQGYERLVDYDKANSEAFIYLDIDDFVVPGEFTTIEIGYPTGFDSSAVILSDLEIRYGKTPEYQSPEVYLSMPMKWAFGIKGQAEVGTPDTCSFTTELHESGSVCELDSGECLCTDQFLRERLPIPYCKNTRTSTAPDATKTGLQQFFTFIDYESGLPLELLVDYSYHDDYLQGRPYDYDWWLSEFKITVTEYAFDARIVESTHLDLVAFGGDGNEYLTSAELAQLMGEDGVYMTIPGWDPDTGETPITRVYDSEIPELGCDDGVDNDGDGEVDCYDLDCLGGACIVAGYPGTCGQDECVKLPESKCYDDEDNDGDGYTDCEDDDCAGKRCFYEPFPSECDSGQCVIDEEGWA